MAGYVQIIADAVHFDGSPVARIMPTGFPQAVEGFKDLIDGLAEEDVRGNDLDHIKTAIDEAAGGWQQDLAAKFKKEAKGGLMSADEFDDFIGDYVFTIGCKTP